MMPDPSRYSDAERVATIDIGTNTALLLVSEWRNETLRPSADETRFVRLGEGVDRTGMISRHSLNRLEATLNEYRSMALDLGAEIVAIAGTSASRDASNQNELVDLVFRVFGASYEILSGEEEALWSFVGSVSGMRAGDSGPFTVIDVGGGSTELISGHAPSSIFNEDDPVLDMRFSLDVGSVRTTERCFSTIPPSTGELQAAADWIDDELAGLDLKSARGSTVVGAAGTATVLGLLASGVRDWNDVNGGIFMATSTTVDWSERLLRMTPAQVLALSPEHLAGREDVFAAGVLIIARCLDKLDSEGLVISPRGLRHGLAIRYFCKTAR